MVILQKKVGNQWVDIVDTSELVDGDVYRRSIGGHVNPQGDLVGNGWEQLIYITPQSPTVKMVGMAEIAEMYSDQVLVDLENYKIDPLSASVDRRIATRILTRIYSNVKINVLSSSFENGLDSLVSKTSMTRQEADDIIAAVQAP